MQSQIKDNFKNLKLSKNSGQNLCKIDETADDHGFLRKEGL